MAKPRRSTQHGWTVLQALTVTLGLAPLLAMLIGALALSTNTQNTMGFYAFGLMFLCWPLAALFFAIGSVQAWRQERKAASVQQPAELDV